MKKTICNNQHAIRFRKFQRKKFSAFCSMHRVVTIGVVAASTLVFALPQSLEAQEQRLKSDGTALKQIDLEEVDVTASRAPLSMSQAAKIVTVITAKEIAAAPVTSVQELLNHVAGVDVRQRGPGGTQADISIRGGTFDQIAVLLNGINLSNPQTGHYSFDIPVNLSDIDHIEIIYGPSSRVFGASAFAGAINIITKTGNNNSVTTDNYGGMHKLWKAEAGINNTLGNLAQRLSASYASTDGYRDNTDYKVTNIFWQSQLKSNDADFRFQAGFNGKRYGANSFYSAAYPNQYDKTRRLFVSASAETHGRIRLAPKVYWTRHRDCFELFRNNPASWYTGHNYHETQVYGANIDATIDWLGGKTAVGAELRNENILSNVLGTDLATKRKVPFADDAYFTKSASRTNVSYFIEHDILTKRFTLSAGLLANYNSSLNQGMRFYPGIDASWRITTNTRLYGSWNRALRMPTFTDLYYKSKTNVGNAALKPEKSEAFELGVKYGCYFLNAHVSAFIRNGKDMIDWVKKNPDDVWQSRNLTKVNNRGIEAEVTFLPKELWGNHFFINSANASFSYINQDKKSEDWISNYALDYLKERATFKLNHAIMKNVTATWQFRWQDRAGSYTKYVNQRAAEETPYKPFSTTDVKIAWQKQALNIYVEANNLFNKKYFDIGNIPQPGFWFRTGFSFNLRY